jgi:hypothetical protein
MTNEFGCPAGEQTTPLWRAIRTAREAREALDRASASVEAAGAAWESAREARKAALKRALDADAYVIAMVHPGREHLFG